MSDDHPPDIYSVAKRKPLTTKQRMEMFIREKGICCVCGGKIDGAKEKWIDEHWNPLWADGSNNSDNRKPAHEKCAGKKTKVEASDRARGRKFAERHFGATRPKNPMPGGRGSKWKKKLSGEVVRRDSE